MSDANRDKLLERYDRDQDRLRNYRAGKGGFEDVGSATADRQAQALDDHYAKDGYGGHGWYEKLRRERDEDRGEDKDYSSAKDYSSPSDQKAKNVTDSLRNGEQGKNETKTHGHDIGEQERGPWNNSAGSSLSDATKNAGSQKQGNFFGRHKKGLIGWIIGIAMGGGMFGVTTLLSGPAQWIQVMNFIKDMTSWVNGAQTGARYLHNMRTLAKWEDNISDTIQNSRLGVVSKRLANTSIKRMEEKGMSFGTRASGNAPSITIDTTKEYGNLFNQDAKGGSASEALKKKRLETLSNKYGVDVSKINLSSDGKLTINFDKMSYSEARKFINATNSVGKFDMVGKIQTRMALKKVGKISWLHPIKKLEQKTINNFADWLTERIKSRALNGFDNIEDAVNAARKTAEDAAHNAGGDVEKAGREAAEKARESMTEALDNVGKEATEKIVKYVIEKTGAKVSASTVTKAIPIVGWIMLAIQVECMVIALDDGIGAEKYATTVATAEGDTAETLGIGSQVMSGHSQDQDLDMTQLGMYTKLKLYNPDVSEVQAESSDDGQQVGETTVGTTSSSWWNAPAVKAALGETYTESERNGVPSSLDDVASSNLSFGGNKLGGQIWSSISKGVESAMNGEGVFGVSNPIFGSYNFAARALGLPTTSQMLCAVLDGIDWLLGQIITALWNTSIFGMLNNYFGISDAIEQTEPAKAMMAWAGNMYMSAMGWLRGNPLNLDTATPEQYGSINMYGGIFSSNEQMLAVGGRALTDSEQLALQIEQKQYLAEQQAQKPLLARLFDPSDYNSTIAQIGRATGIDTSDQSVGTQLKNVGKIFASVPKLFSYALGKIGGNANAATAGSYDYGVPMVAFSQSEMTKITGGDSSYDLESNTEKVFSMVDAGNLDNDKVKKCFGAEIGNKSSGYTVTQLDNTEGKAWNYADSLDSGTDSGNLLLYSGYNNYESDCMNSDMLAVRTYMLDYATLVSADCYENDGWAGGESADSCSEMGFTGSSSSAGETSVTIIDGAAFPLGNVSKTDVPESSLSYGHVSQVPGYLAVDIIVSEGTPVLSMTEGEVVRVKDGSDLYGATSIQVRTGEYIYYYTHLATGAEVKVGDKVTAGQRIGKVGTAAQGNGTEHLHLDASKWPEGQTRGSCSRTGGCFDTSKFLDILPTLKNLQAALPDN